MLRCLSPQSLMELSSWTVTQLHAVPSFTQCAVQIDGFYSICVLLWRVGRYCITRHHGQIPDYPFTSSPTTPYLLLHSSPMPFLIIWIYMICVSPFSCPESPSSSSLMGGFLSGMLQTSPHLRTHFLHGMSLPASLAPRALSLVFSDSPTDNFLTRTETIIYTPHVCSIASHSTWHIVGGTQQTPCRGFDGWMNEWMNEDNWKHMILAHSCFSVDCGIKHTSSSSSTCLQHQPNSVSHVFI